MDNLELLVSTSLIFPVLVTAGVMWFVKRTWHNRQKERNARKKQFEYMAKTIELQEKIIETKKGWKI